MTTISQLQTSVDAWLIRDDVAVTGEDFQQILLNTESEISREYRFLVQEVTTTLTFDGRSQDLPADFLEVRNPFIDDNRRRFEYKTPQAIRESAEWENGRVAQSYTLEGSADPSGSDDRIKMVIAGPASTESPLDVDVNYYRRFPALDIDNGSDTNWLLTNHFDIYLFECLYQAAIYIQETELAARYLAIIANPAEAPGVPLGLRQRTAKMENRKRFGAMPKQSYGSPRAIV